MSHGIILALLVLVIVTWTGGVLCVMVGNRSFYRWHRPLCDAGILPPNGRGPALATWRRLLGSEPEQDAEAEVYRCSAKRWFLRFFGFAVSFCLCIGPVLVLA